MDIQELVESRIAELRARDNTVPPPHAEVDAGGMTGPQQGGHRRQPPPDEDRSPRRPAGAVSGERREAEGERPAVRTSVDSRLNEVMERVMDITERISVDCGRMEQDLLRSRLEVLQGAEAVLEIILTLRRQMMGASVDDRYSRRDAGGSSPSGLDMGMSQGDDILGVNTGRASMKEYGVADLFRRT